MPIVPIGTKTSVIRLAVQISHWGEALLSKIHAHPLPERWKRRSDPRRAHNSRENCRLSRWKADFPGTPAAETASLSLSFPTVRWRRHPPLPSSPFLAVRGQPWNDTRRETKRTTTTMKKSILIMWRCKLNKWCLERRIAFVLNTLHKLVGQKLFSLFTGLF